MRRTTKNYRAGFSLIELVIVTIVIVLCITLTLPVLAQTRDQSLVSVSKDNLRQLGVAHRMYAADHNDNQWTLLPHDFAQYGGTALGALSGWCDALGASGEQSGTCVSGTPALWIGYATHDDGNQYMWVVANSTHMLPLLLDEAGTDSPGGSGLYRLSHLRAFNRYVNGTVYDPTFFAPKHESAIELVGDCFDDPYDYCVTTGHVQVPTYSLSPAAMYHPEMWNVPEGEFPSNMNALFSFGPSGFANAFQTPTYSQARFPHLKTHMMENVWLQNNDQGQCIPGGVDDWHPYTYGECDSWLFNASIHSEPATLFYDGHVRLLPLSEVKVADEQIGVWRSDTPFGESGYFHELGLDGPKNPQLSHHILTNGGIKGRDTLGPNGAPR